MKRIVAFCLALCVMICGMSGCARPEPQQEPRLKVVASFYPIYIMLLNLTDGIPQIQVDNMAGQQTGCLHDFQMQTDDMKNLESADAFVINGAGMESFLDKVVEELPSLTVVDSSVGIPLIASGEEEPEEEAHHEGDGHDHHSDYNPHLWVSISNYIQQVENIRDGLAALDPAYAGQYQKNCEEYVGKLGALRQRMHQELDGLPHRDIVTFHEAFPYFAQEFNLHIAAVINREPESEPSARELANTILLVRSTGVKALFVEPQYPKTAADIISNETEAQVYVLDPGVSGKEEKDAYLDIMEQNLQVLITALQ